MSELVLFGRHHPHEVAFFALSVLLGVAYVFGSPLPSSVAVLLPLWATKTWAVALLFSGPVGLVGCFWTSDAERALRLEVGALLIQSGAMSLYTAALFTVGGLRALAAGGLAAAWVGANLWRVRGVRRNLRDV